MDDDEELLHRFGTPLEPLEEDQVLTKKPLHVQDQVVKDENGKRRFHGAFTGGFSAGYWNTVGSQEGWTPQSFKSSRNEKTGQRSQQRPEDFMDSEDLGEFGIAPQRIQIHEDFGNGTEESRKRKHMPPSAGPIPGVPVLQQLLKPMGDKVAVRILKTMGWRPGQGVGPRLTRKQKKKVRQHNMRELYLMEQYGYKLDEEKTAKAAVESDEDEVDTDADDDEEEEEITFAPDDFEPYLCIPRNNRYGLGYTGLSREPVLAKDTKISTASSATGHFNLFEGLGKNNQKFSIRGQAFGVGALEEDDEDIYTHDDMSKYDFSLESKAAKKKTQKHVQDNTIIEGFAAIKDNIQYKPPFTVDMPIDFRPRNWAERKSRFAPLEPEKARQLSSKMEAQKRHLNPDKRGAILGEQTQSSAPSETSKPNLKLLQEIQITRADKTKELLERISAKTSNFTRGGLITEEGEEKSRETLNELQAKVKKDNQTLLEKVTEKSKLSGGGGGVASGAFKPFLADESKQQRYEQFVAANLRDEQAITNFLSDIQPVHLSQWDRQMEKQEFMQARNMYKPLAGIMSDRFVSETTVELKKDEVAAKPAAEKKIVTERLKTMWKPSALLCKRYNIAEPFGGTMVEEKKPQRSKLSVFDYLETSVNTKANFQTPVIIPKHIEKPQAIVKQTEQRTAESGSPVKAKEEAVHDKKQQLPATATTTAASAKEVKPLLSAPKTALEKRCEETRDVPASEKVELFKAIFEDSDDDEAEAEAETKENETTKNSATIESINAEDNMASGSMKPLSAAAVNLLRNTSPPRGIFAALFTNSVKQIEPALKPKESETSAGDTAKLAKTERMENSETPKITFKSKKERCDNTAEEEQRNVTTDNADTYGPRLPENLKPTIITPTNNEIPESDVDDKLFRLLEHQKSAKYIKEIWVEKSTVNNKNSCSSSDSDSSSTSVNSDSNKKHKKKMKKSKKKSHKNQKKKSKKKTKKHEKSHKSKKSKYK